MSKLLTLSVHNQLLDKVCAEAGESSLCYTNTTGDTILFLPELKEEFPQLAAQIREVASKISKVHVLDSSQWVKLSS